VVSTKYPLRLLWTYSNLYIARRVVVYTPQVYKNFTLKSGEGLSVAFVVIWLVGDLFNLIGASRAGLLPTVIILAGYVRLFLLPVLILHQPLTSPFVTVYPLRYHPSRPNILLSLVENGPAGATTNTTGRRC
jgi:hypothetical protein